jgi:hypothetical protein
VRHGEAWAQYLEAKRRVFERHRRAADSVAAQVAAELETSCAGVEGTTAVLQRERIMLLDEKSLMKVRAFLHSCSSNRVALVRSHALHCGSAGPWSHGSS